jgi:hypothetical protein
MDKIDLFREHKDEYVTSREPRVVNVGAGTYLTVSGTGAPESAEFQRKVGALYGCAYTVKFDSKLRRRRDFKVGVLEGLWWTNGKADVFAAPRTTWRWKMLIRVPSFVSGSAVAAALRTLGEKGKPTAAVKRETIREGRAVQALHVGPYGEEPRTLERMARFARDHGLRYRGRHHEIYLSDPRRVAPSRIRTILRHPVTPGTARRTA